AGGHAAVPRGRTRRLAGVMSPGSSSRTGRHNRMLNTRGIIARSATITCKSATPPDYFPGRFGGMGSKPHLAERRIRVTASRVGEAIMQKIAKRFVKDESGATAIEYGLIAALIAVGIITAAKTLGTQIGTTFSTVSPAMKNA